MDCFHVGRLSGTAGTVWQYTALAVASASLWAELHVTPKNPAAQWTAALAQRVAADLAGRTQTNGCVERVQGTVLEACWKPAFARSLVPKYTGLRLDLDRYVRYDSIGRVHTGRWTRGRTPDEVLGKAAMWTPGG